MRRLLCTLLVIVAAGFAGLGAQAPAGPATDLPIRRVVLYKSGIGFFEHVGRVTGNQRVAVGFTSAQLDDVLKTLTVLDLDGGVVSSVGFNSQAPLDRRLGDLGLPVGDASTLAGFLASLRGARLELGRGGTTVSGRLLSVEQGTRTRGDVSEDVATASIVSDAGAVHTMDLGPGTTVRFADPALNARVTRYLELLAASTAQDRRTLDIATSGSGQRRLYVSYVSEVPVWKTTYRLILPSGSDTPRLQGWAIVDNTVGEDWTGVELSLVAGSPQSFIQALSQPLYARRPTVPMSAGLLPQPQLHGGAITGASRTIAARVVDSSGAVLPGVSVRLSEPNGRLRSVVTDAQGRFAADVDSGPVRAQFTLSGFKQAQATLQPGVEQLVTLQVGSTTETVTVGALQPGVAIDRAMTGGSGGGVVGGVVGGAPARVGGNVNELMLTATSSAATARDLGDLFEYKLNQPVTIRQNQSAMVPIVSSHVGAERVSLWNRTDRSPRPRRAVWVTNDTGQTLDGGSVTILDADTFAGEGLVDSLKPGERRLVSYAVDLGMRVDASPGSASGQFHRAQLAHGVMTLEFTECNQVKYVARNDDSRPRHLVIEHPRPDGWTLVENGPSPAETATGLWRFALDVAPKTTAGLTVTAYHPGAQQIALNSATDDDLRVYLKDLPLNDALKQALSDIMTAKADIAALAARSDVARQQVTDLQQDQERIRKNLASLKGSSEEKALVQRYVKELDAQEDHLRTLQQQMADLERQRAEAQAAVDRRVEAFTLDAGPGAASPCGGN